MISNYMILATIIFPSFPNTGENGDGGNGTNEVPDICLPHCKTLVSGPYSSVAKLKNWSVVAGGHDGEFVLKTFLTLPMLQKLTDIGLSDHWTR